MAAVASHNKAARTVTFQAITSSTANAVANPGGAGHHQPNGDRADQIPDPRGGNDRTHGEGPTPPPPPPPLGGEGAIPPPRLGGRGGPAPLGVGRGGLAPLVMVGPAARRS